MKLRNALVIVGLSALASGTALAQTGGQIRMEKVNPNAGTGPYDSELQNGITLQIDLSGFYRGLADLRQGIRSGLPPDQLLLKVQSIASEVDLAFSGYRGHRSFQEILRDLTGAIENFKAVKGGPQSFDQTTALQFANKLGNAVQAEATRLEEVTGLVNLKTGFFFRRDATYRFDTITLSTGEFGMDHHKSAAFITGGDSMPLDGASRAPTWRIGVGTAFGDPYRAVGSVSAATYLSPGVFDLTASLSMMLASETLPVEKPHTRTVVDHIRPGDTWFTVSARQLSGSTDETLLPNGTIGEAEMTIALPHRYPGSYASTTFSLSGIYCANKDLGIDEFGAELRTPLAAGLHPIFLSARYGTRGHYTLALDFKL